MNFLFLILLALSTSLQQENNNMKPDRPLITVSEPATTYSLSTVYLETVSIVHSDTTSIITVDGYLPESCSNLYSAAFDIEADSLIISMKSWRPRDAMCLQALQPFRFIYESDEFVKSPNLKKWIMELQEGDIIYH